MCDISFMCACSVFYSSTCQDKRCTSDQCGIYLDYCGLGQTPGVSGGNRTLPAQTFPQKQQVRWRPCIYQTEELYIPRTGLADRVRLSGEVLITLAG